VPTTKVAPPVTASAVPSPSYGQFLPVNFHVSKVLQVDMDGGTVPEEVVTSTGPNNGSGSGAQELLVLAWDGYAQRWTAVFNSSTVDVPSTSPGSPPSTGLFSQGLGVSELSVASIHSRPGALTDILITAKQQFGDGVGLFVGIVSYASQVAQLQYTFDGETGGSAHVVGFGNVQRVQVTTGYITEADPHCCPIRDWQFEINAKPGASDGYEVSNDDRPWIGAVVELSGPSTAGTATVLKTWPNTPASGKLRPGDVLTGVSGTRLTAHQGQNGPAVIDEIALHHPGDTIALDINRGGTQIVAALTLVSRSAPFAPDPAPTGGYLGVDLQNTPGGPEVTQVASGGPAASAQIPIGAVIRQIAGVPVRTAEQAIMRILLIAPGTATAVAYVDQYGTPGEVRATIGSPPLGTDLTVAV
jgi:hypothetical protein